MSQEHEDLWRYTEGNIKARKELEDLYYIKAAYLCAPVAFMDKRPGLGVCALKESDFPILESLKGRRIKLIAIDPYLTEK